MIGVVYNRSKLKKHKRGYTYYELMIKSVPEREVYILHLVPQYSNFRGWSFLVDAQLPITLDGLETINEGTFINKDIFPKVIEYPKLINQQKLL